MSVPLNPALPVPGGPLRLFAVMSDANKGEKTFSDRVCQLYIKGLGTCAVWWGGQWMVPVASRLARRRPRGHSTMKNARSGRSRNTTGADILSSAALAGEGSLRMAVRLKGKSNLTNAIPSVIIPDAAEGEHPMDVLYSLQYSHSIKGSDVMEIILMRKKNPVTTKTVAVATVLLQSLVRPLLFVCSVIALVPVLLSCVHAPARTCVRARNCSRWLTPGWRCA